MLEGETKDKVVLKGETKDKVVLEGETKDKGALDGDNLRINHKSGIACRDDVIESQIRKVSEAAKIRSERLGKTAEEFARQLQETCERRRRTSRENYRTCSIYNIVFSQEGGHTDDPKNRG